MQGTAEGGLGPSGRVSHHIAGKVIIIIGFLLLPWGTLISKVKAIIKLKQVLPFYYLLNLLLLFLLFLLPLIIIYCL